jgi:hypothetical protein
MALKKSIADMSKAELIAHMAGLEQKVSAMAGGLIVKLTDKGGIYIRDNSFIEFSQTRLDRLVQAENDKYDKAVAKGGSYTKKVLTHNDGKYTACINVAPNSARELFLNPERLDSVIAQVKELL